jgi:glycosyltransferase involved in cell wall biosynthesis
VSERPVVALFMPSFAGGGAERVMVNLANHLEESDLEVDMVVAHGDGPHRRHLSEKVRVVDLGKGQTLKALPDLVRYLKDRRPEGLLSALNHANVTSIMAKRLARVPTRVVVSVHNNLTNSLTRGSFKQRRLEPAMIRRFYPKADGVVAVSKGVAESVVQVAGLPRDRIQVILNPVVSEETLQKAKAPVEHPWFSNGGAPVVLAIGRMTEQKDFPNLLRALALLVQRRPARVLILGEGEDRPALEALAKELNLGPDVLDMPGFVENPYAYMARCDVLAMSSRWEGLPTVLIEGLACGASIVSTACPSGPDEILEDGRSTGV